MTARSSRFDARLVALAAAHGGFLCLFPSAPAIALGLWWNSNTISHNFIHRPFFRSRVANFLFGIFLSALLGIPQSLWRDRHLGHHAGVRPRVRLTLELLVQLALVFAVWTVVALHSSRLFLTAYLPGYLAGLGLCALQGHYEHAAGTTSHYGRLYNFLFFNDGFHAEHHANPGLSWRLLPRHAVSGARVSAWPAVLRWLDCLGLEAMERLVLRLPLLQRMVLRSHTRAIQELAAELPEAGRVAIVGGGMFPRTAMILERLMPAAQITVIDADRVHLDQARAWLNGRGANMRFVHSRYEASTRLPCDLLVIPLCFAGDREAIYARPPAPVVLVHDWIWRKRGVSRIVSLGLLKRINLVHP